MFESPPQTVRSASLVIGTDRQVEQPPKSKYRLKMLNYVTLIQLIQGRAMLHFSVHKSFTYLTASLLALACAGTPVLSAAAADNQSGSDDIKVTKLVAQKSSSQKSSKKPSSKTSKTDSNLKVSNNLAEVKTTLLALKEALSRGDAEKAAAAWSEDGSFVNMDGLAFKNRKEIQKRFQDVFAKEGRPSITFNVQRVKELNDSAVLIEGLVHRNNGPAADNVESRFSMAVVKEGGRWSIKSASESPYRNDLGTQDNPLDAFNWLIGNWKVENENGRLDLKVDWAHGKNFISCLYLIKHGNSSEPESRQVIGFDPINQAPISWSFDASGGYGQARWIKEGNKWLIDSCGVDREGNQTTCTNVITMVDKDTFTWQSINRTINGESLSDTAALKLEKLSK